MTERVDSDVAYFRILAADVVFFDHRLHEVPHGFFGCSLSGNGGQAGSFSKCAPARCQALVLCAATA